MQCNCGGETNYCSHEVKTLEKAQEWYPEITIVPIIVNYDKCTTCGRIEKRQATRGEK